jgi:hypothetical protein
MLTTLWIALILAGQGKPAAALKTLTVEAGVVLKSGDAKPAARTNVYLLDRDVADILKASYGQTPVAPTTLDAASLDALKSAGIDPAAFARETAGDLAASRAPNPVHAFALQYKVGQEYSPDTTDPQLTAIRTHAVASTVTDFVGKGTLRAPAGAYYLFSVATIGKNTILWSLKVDLTDGQSLVLDNRNAAEIIN